MIGINCQQGKNSTARNLSFFCQYVDVSHLPTQPLGVAAAIFAI
jgi:hypothetical protein